MVLVTSAFHMLRAVMLFRQEGTSVTPFPVDFQTVEARGVLLTDFLPSAEGLAKVELALKEFYGLAYYWLRPRGR